MHSKNKETPPALGKEEESEKGISEPFHDCLMVSQRDPKINFACAREDEAVILTRGEEQRLLVRLITSR